MNFKRFLFIHTMLGQYKEEVSFLSGTDFSHFVLSLDVNLYDIHEWIV